MKTVTKRLRELAIVLWVDTETNDLWKQIIKCSIASIGSVVAVMTPQAAAVLGPSTFLAPMATVFAHPGQRLGPMIETLLMMLLGTLFGLAWSIVALRLSMLATAQTTHETAHNAICAVFFTMAAFFHGYVRSASPRMFLFVTFFSYCQYHYSARGLHLGVFRGYYTHLLPYDGWWWYLNRGQPINLSRAVEQLPRCVCH